jgi:hypothetical protein
MNAVEIEEAVSGLAEQPFDAESLPFAFLEAFGNKATIADLYDPKKMPENLRAAHDRNDETLERIYIGRRFRNDTERLEKLFELYTKMTQKKEMPAGRATST